MYIQGASQPQPPNARGGENAATDRAVTRYSTAFLLKEEFRALRGREPNDSEFDADGVATASAGLSALCLSGGGIRSAAFALGVTQALARRGLLTRFDYLSTVSGGGYLGGFLQRLIISTPSGARDEHRAQNKLASRNAAKEDNEVAKLREYSNFITPRVGAMSDDSWTALATSGRNIFLNWLLFAPLFLLLTIPPQIYFSLLIAADTTDAVAALVLAMLSLTWATSAIASALPSNAVSPAEPRFIGLHIVIPLLVFSLTLPVAVASDNLGRAVLSPFKNGTQSAPALTSSAAYLLAATAVLMAAMVGFLLPAARAIRGREVRRRNIWLDLPLWLVASSTGAALFVVGGVLLDHNFKTENGKLTNAAALATFAPPAVMGIVTFVGIFVSAARTVWRDSAKLVPDLDREWLARLSAIAIKPVIVWLLLSASVLLIGQVWDAFETSDFVKSLSLEGIGSYFVTLGAVLGFVAALTGRSSATSGIARRLFSLEILASGGTIAFAVFAIAGFALIEVTAATSLAQKIQALLAHTPFDHPQINRWYLVAANLVVAAALVLSLICLGYVIDINRFSLNGFYRNRIARAFLGAAREGLPNESGGGIRQPDPFTGFDTADNVRLSQLWSAPAQSGSDSPVQPRALYPVINVALNAVATRRLSWQERKAQPFILTPIACGSGMMEGTGQPENSGLYVQTEKFGSREQDERMPGTGITVAAALAISGAAVSPNMGYHSSPATTFLMTLFNLRLGAWLPNPTFDAKGSVDPATKSRNSIALLIREMLGLTNDLNPDIYLSDGGHFENLGLYEMVRRRCRLIVVVDAGCDPDRHFADLGNAIRKCAIDLDTAIDFPDADAEGRTVMIGRICYPGFEGQILYIKPHLPLDVPIDIAAYASKHEDFPHESTTDQWYSESQFESYRHLGQHIADGVLDRAGLKDGDALERMFSKVRKVVPDLGAPQEKAPKAPAPEPSTAA